MKILITGGAGYIGSHTAELLHKADHQIVLYDNLSTGCREAALHGELVVGDLSDQSSLDQLFKQRQFDAVIHFAASLSVKESVARPSRYYRNNTANTLGLIEKCCECKVSYFIFSSSAAVYGEAEGAHSIAETAPTCPINPYGRSKLMSEQMLRDIAPLHRMKYANLRYYNVAGSEPELRLGARKRAENLVPMICRAATGQMSALKIYGTDYPTQDGTCVRDYIHVSDLADIHVRALQYLVDGNDSMTLNCGYGRGYSVRQMIDAAKEVTGVDFPVIETARRPLDPTALIANVDKLSATLKWKPAFDDIRTIIETAWKWEQKLRQQESRL